VKKKRWFVFIATPPILGSVVDYIYACLTDFSQRFYCFFSKKFPRIYYVLILIYFCIYTTRSLFYMIFFENLLGTLHSWIWGPPLLALLIGTGIYLTFLLRGLQFRHLGYALKLVFSKQRNEGEGDISNFQSLMTALAATIGVGTIAGLATAVAIGGLGAIFWMILVGLIGMVTKYSECLLAVHYREVDAAGRMAGGPMYYLQKGLKCRWLGVLFAVFGAITALGTGNLVQANAVADVFFDFLGVDPWITGVILAVLVGSVVLGGIHTIGRVSGVLVPVMAVMYFIGCLIILGRFYYNIPITLLTIVDSAFHGQAPLGGFLGSTMLLSMQEGVSKGIFSNESGLGSAPIASAAARTDHSGRQAMIAMMGTFFTLIITFVTGIALGVSGVIGTIGPSGKVLIGAPLTLRAFAISFPGGDVLLIVGLVLFAFSTIVGWGYYGEKCCEYLFGFRSIRLYRIVFTLVVIPGAIFSLKTVWCLSGIMNGLMAIPNLIGLLGLSFVVLRETKSFLKLSR
jgi:alanine or glycine:cation symporter, AGCS family